MDQLFHFLGGSWELVFFISIQSVLNGEKLIAAASFLPWMPWLCCTYQKSMSGNAEAVPLGSSFSLENWGDGCMNQPLPSPEWSWELGLVCLWTPPLNISVTLLCLQLVIWCCTGARVSGKRYLISPYWLSEYGFTLFQEAEDFQLVSAFLKRQFVLELFLNWYVCGEKGDPELPTLPCCWHHS